MRDYMTLTELNKRIGVGRTTLWRWLNAGLGPRYWKTPMGVVKIARVDAEEWIRSLKLPDARRCR